MQDTETSGYETAQSDIVKYGMSVAMQIANDLDDATDNFGRGYINAVKDAQGR